MVELGKRQNQLSEARIAKIIDTYKNRHEDARYSRRVEMAEIDLSATHQQLVSIEADIQAAKDKHNVFLKS